MIRLRVVRVVRIVLLALLLWGLLFVIASGMFETRGIEPTPRPGERRVLIAPEGLIDLRDAPCSPVARLTAKAGTLVVVREIVEGCGGSQWARVELAEGAQGWVPLETLSDPATSGPSIGNFGLCAGDRAGPILPCNRTPRLADGGVWLRYDFAGLAAGDQIELVLEVDGRRYVAGPETWISPPFGHALVNLAEGATPPAGRWTLHFLVNTEPISSVTFEVQ